MHCWGAPVPPQKKWLENMLWGSTQKLHLHWTPSPGAAILTVDSQFYGAHCFSACSGLTKWLQWQPSNTLAGKVGLPRCLFGVDFPGKGHPHSGSTSPGWCGHLCSLTSTARGLSEVSPNGPCDHCHCQNSLEKICQELLVSAAIECI